MNRLDADTLAVVLPSQTARCKMTCVSNYFAVMLRSLVESYRARAVRRVTWKEKKLVIRLHLNAPHTLRLVWRSFGTTKELRINMLTVTSAGRIIADGSFQLVGMEMTYSITRRGVVRSSSLSYHIVVVTLLPTTLRVDIHSAYGQRSRLPDGKRGSISLVFPTARKAYDQMLKLLAPNMWRRAYGAPRARAAIF